jgi:hypothetical protein
MSTASSNIKINIYIGHKKLKIIFMEKYVDPPLLSTCSTVNTKLLKYKAKV